MKIGNVNLANPYILGTDGGSNGSAFQTFM